MKIKCLIALVVLSSINVLARDLDTEKCVKAIAGEASGEPYKAKLGIAAVIRARGSLAGIYGLNASHKESKTTLNICRKAWNESKWNNPVPGCKYFGGICDDWYFQGKLHLKPFVTIGHTRFYK